MATWTDGDFPAGTPIITVERGVTDVAFICDDWSYSNQTRLVTRTNQNGEETDAKGIQENPTGSATVQVDTATVARIVPGETFTVTSPYVTTPPDDTEIGATVFIVITADSPREKDGYFKQSITFRKRINAPA